MGDEADRIIEDGMMSDDDSEERPMGDSLDDYEDMMDSTPGFGRARPMASDKLLDDEAWAERERLRPLLEAAEAVVESRMPHFKLTPRPPMPNKSEHTGYHVGKAEMDALRTALNDITKETD